MESKKAKPIVEEREESMVCATGGKPTLRTARFLHPFVTSVDEAMEVPHVPPLLSEIISSKSLETWPLKIQFKSWRAPQRKWKQWVDKLVRIHEAIWRKACIYDAIMASTYKVNKDENLVFGLVELWCPETNTFVFPWGEATITLEDMLILGGFSVLGEPVTSPLDENQVKIKDRLDEERTKRPAYCSWMNLCMENDIDRNLEHIMFLVIWLSRYVFHRSPPELIGKHVFSIALHLARGTRIALAPAVLSRLYRDLCLFNKNVVASNDSCDVWGLFHILQMWVWEHFRSLRPDMVNILREGEPRVARWHEMKTRFDLKLVRSVLKSPENFQWRCYAQNVNNWRHPSFYNEKEMWVLNDSNIDDELQSFAQCLIASELVGIDCIEQYLPHRVAMQFGLDQDLPGCFTRANSRWDYAWKTYNKSVKNAAFYVPPRLFESDVTTRYLEWWKQSRGIRSGETTMNLLHQRRVEDHKVVENEGSDPSHGSGPPGFPPRNKKNKWQEDIKLESWSDDFDQLPISQSLKLIGNRTEVVNLPVTLEKPSSSSSQPRTSQPKKILGNTDTKGRSSTEKNASTVTADKTSSTTQYQTLLQPSIVLGNTTTKRRSSRAVTKKNASTRGDRIEDSTQNDLDVGRDTVTNRTIQDTELEDRVLKLEKYFARLKAMKAKVELKKTTKK